MSAAVQTLEAGLVLAEPGWDSEKGFLAADRDGGAAEGDDLDLKLPPAARPPKCLTLVLHLSVPADAKIWALNLCPGEHDDAAEVIAHFNPRRVERGAG